MLEVTDAALANVKDYLRQQEIDSPIRVYVVSEGCRAPILGLGLDEIKSADRSFVHDDVTFIVDVDLLASCGAIKVDFIEKSQGGCGCGSGGFAISSENPLATGGCGCSCSSGSCG